MKVTTAAMVMSRHDQHAQKTLINYTKGRNEYAVFVKCVLKCQKGFFMKVLNFCFSSVFSRSVAVSEKKVFKVIGTDK